MSDSNKRATADVKPITKALAEPFEQMEVKFKPQMVKNNRALAIAYVDARVVQDRLDDVLGVEGWSDEYDLLPDGSAVCRLRCKLGGEWLTKMDVGSPSEQPDAGDRVKAAFSDALKRAAVKFGVGRYLYRLPAVWVDYDPVKRQLVRPPQLPEFARPKAKNDDSAIVEAPKPRLVKKPAAHALPADGAELRQRLTEYDAKLAAQGLCAKGELLKHVTAIGTQAGHGEDLGTWAGPAIGLAVEATRAFEMQLRSRPEQKAVA